MSDLAWMRPRLAELCGIRLIDEAGVYITHPRHCCGCEWGCEWRPDEDIAQAIRCWKAVQNKAPNGDYFCCMDIRRPINEEWEVAMTLGKSDHQKPDVLILRQKSLPRAICLAIARALGWEP